MFKEFFKYQKRILLRYFQENKVARISVSILMLVLIAFIAWGVFYAAKLGLEFTQTEKDIFMNQIGPLYIYEILLVITGFLIFVSSTVFGLVNFFKAYKDNWIMASPKYKKMLWVNSFKAINHSTWAIVIISIPLLIAAGQIFNFSFLAVFLSVLAVLFFAIICSLLAIMIIFIFSIIMNQFKIKSFKVLVLLVSAVVVYMALFVWQKIINMNLEKVFQVDNIVNPNLSLFLEYFSVFPSHYPAMVIFNFQIANNMAAIKYVSILLLALFIIFLIFKVLESKFLNIWQGFQEGSFEAKREKKETNRHVLEGSFPKSAEAVIYKKELLTSLRSAKNFLWFSFLAILLFAQVGVITLLDKYSSIGDGFVLGDNMIAVQLVIVLFFITAFIIRFVFPSFSQESDTSWIMGSAPIKMSKVFLTKFKLFTLVLILLGVLSLLLYIIPLEINLYLSLLLNFIVIISVATLSMFGLALGAIYINFETNDPNDLSTSAPGIIFMISALIYIALATYIFYLSISSTNYLLLILFTLFSLIAILIFKNLAIKSLEKMEYY
ncbi:MAG: putative ABC transporter permease subunit [Parcubacteria group bacterium]